jgi:hypothetical protein
MFEKPYLTIVIFIGELRPKLIHEIGPRRPRRLHRRHAVGDRRQAQRPRRQEAGRPFPLALAAQVPQNHLVILFLALFCTTQSDSVWNNPYLCWKVSYDTSFV